MALKNAGIITLMLVVSDNTVGIIFMGSPLSGVNTTDNAAVALPKLVPLIVIWSKGLPSASLSELIPIRDSDGGVDAVTVSVKF
jgi:hypothetical protein